MSADVSIRELLRDNTAESAPELVLRTADGSLQCVACGLRCILRDGREGACRVRFREGEVIRVPWGYVAGLQVDPIEKKPFYHAYPGRDALSFGMLGCDFHCSYCQNWVSSQTLRDERATAHPTFVDPEQVVALAVRHDAPVMVSTYNEPLITADWAVEIFRLANQEGIVCGFVSNGNATPEVLEYIRPHVELYKIDLKTFSDRQYRKLGGTLASVLDTIRLTHAMGFWVEIVTLVVPGFNDSDDELRRIADFIASVSSDMPWHVTAFHPDYKMLGPARTPARTLLRACEIGKAAGLHHVYAGNAAGAVGAWEHTNCPGCGETLIRRSGFLIRENNMRGSRCGFCEQPVAGRWEDKPAPPRGGGVWPMPLKSC